MAREIKVMPTYTKSIQGREVTGIFAVHGIIDYVGDRSHPGSFSKTIREQGAGPGSAIKYLWSHNMDFGAAGPPVAVVTGLKEVGADELPDQILKRWPEATGGVEVTRKYLQTVRGEEVYQGLVEGAITAQSYGYDPVQVKYTDVPAGKVRELWENKLFEVSDVLWGANPATMASKLWTPDGHQALEHIKAVLIGLNEGWLARALEAKAGARHNAADTKLLNAIHKAVITLGATNCKGTTEEDAEKESDGDGKEKGEKNMPRAGALPPLDALSTQLAILELEAALR